MGKARSPTRRFVLEMTVGLSSRFLELMPWILLSILLISGVTKSIMLNNAHECPSLMALNYMIINLIIIVVVVP